VKIFSLNKMLGLLAIGGAVAYARSKKIDVLGMLGLRKDAAAPADDKAAATAADSAPASSAPGFGSAEATSRIYGSENRSGHPGYSPSNNNRNGTGSR
jgi:hypothetical protein